VSFTRRSLFAFLPVAATCLAADTRGGEKVRGKLTVNEGRLSAVDTPEHKSVQLDGDDATRKVLGDKRLDGVEVQATGRFTAPGRFTIDPIHTRALLVNDRGILKLVTYWCDICGIRSYTPGPCVCCQKNTDLELRDPEHLDDK